MKSFDDYLIYSQCVMMNLLMTFSLVCINVKKISFQPIGVQYSGREEREREKKKDRENECAKKEIFRSNSH